MYGSSEDEMVFQSLGYENGKLENILTKTDQPRVKRRK
jgi:hypothetical protein